jgi:Secretion system C-terminal sorting domain
MNENVYTKSSSYRKSNGRWKWLLSTAWLCLIALYSHAQVTTNSGSGLAATYPSLDAAITALNGATISSPVVITLTAANPQTTPNGGYSITASGDAVNTITINGNNNTITAGAAPVAGSLIDAIFKIVGGDYITLNGFNMQEHGNSTFAAATNNMTEWGVALLYATTTNGAQNCTISNCTIDMNRLYQNSFGIYSNSTHNNATATITTTASATGLAGSNSGLTIIKNTITDVNNAISVVGPTTAADFNNVLIIGGSVPNANTITNFGNIGTFSGYANVNASVNGILVRNTNNIDVSYNSITSNTAGSTGGTIRGIYLPFYSTTPTGTIVNNINNNTIAIKSSVATGIIQGIVSDGSAANQTTTFNINNNDFNNFGHALAASGTITFISTTSVPFTNTINGNTFTNMSVNTTGGVTFISQSYTAPLGASKAVNNNSIVTGFTKTGAGGTVIFVTDNGSTVAGATSNCLNNNFSNVTLTGATGLTGINYTDGGTAPTRTVTGNTINNITTGASTINAMNFTYWSGVSALFNNTVTNLNGQGAITGITIGSSANGATSITIGPNTITNLISTGTGGSVTGITCSNTSTGINIVDNKINTLSTTGGFSVVNGINISGALNTTLTRNKIYDLSGSAAGVSVNGVNIASGTTLNITNNLIGDLRATTATGANAINGINAGASSTYNIFNNTVRLDASSTSATTFGSSCVLFSSTVTSLNLRNNVLVNLSTPAQNGSNNAANGSAVCLRRSAGTNGTIPANYATTSNNNLFWCNPTAGTNNHLTYAESTITLTNPKNTLPAMKTFMVNRDQASVSESPTFLSTTGASPVFLHIDPATATQIESAGAPAAGVTVDFDGDTRNVSTPDIGADEFAGIPADLTGPAISYTAFSNSSCAANQTISATITDGSGVELGAGIKPRVWFRKSTNLNSIPATNDNTTDGWKYFETASLVNPFLFTIDLTQIFGGATNGDIIEYFVAAQDNQGTPNISLASTTPTGTPLSVALVSNFPVTGSNSYTILPAGLSGTVTIGAAGTYTSLTGATGLFAAINAAGLSGNLTANIVDAAITETSAVQLNNVAYGCASSTLTIKPTVVSVLTGNTAGAVITLNGADNVVIDGSIGATANTVCPPSVAGRDLTIVNSNVGTSSAVVWMQTAISGSATSATNNTIQNCNISGNTNITTLIGIGSGSNTISVGSLGTANNNNSFVNNNISKTQYGIYSQGASISNKNTGTVINQNLINTVSPDNVSRGGIATGFENNLTISGNNISGMAQTTGTIDSYGISLGLPSITASSTTGNEVTNATVTSNTIGSVRQESTYSAMGISVASASTGTNLIANNMLSGVGANGTSSDMAAGIFIGGGAGSITNIYYNTITMAGTFTGATDVNAGIAISGLDPVINLLNNIISVTATTGANENRGIALAYSTYANLNSNFNSIFVSGTNAGIGYTGSIAAGTVRTSLLDWQTATTKDANSLNISPIFISSTDLHLDAANAANALLDGGGTITPILVDKDCAARGNVANDIGAFEFTYVPPLCLTPSAVSVTAITPVSATVNFTCATCTGTYIVEYGAPGFTPGIQNTAGIGGTLVLSATATPVALTGLVPQTAYQVYVRQECSVGVSYSINSTVQSFITPCTAISALPYSEGFNTIGSTPACWSIANLGTGNNWTFPSTGGDATPPHTGSALASLNWTSANNNDALLISPAFDLTAYPARNGVVKVWIYRRTQGLVTDRTKYYVNTTQSITGAALLLDMPLVITEAPTVATTGWYEYSFEVPVSYNTAPFYIIVRGNTTTSGSSYTVGVDDFSLELGPPCPNFQNLALVSDQTTIAASWTNSGAATGYKVIWEAGTCPNPNCGESALLPPSTTNYNITGLSAGAIFTVTVRAYCSGDSTDITKETRTFTCPAAQRCTYTATLNDSQVDGWEGASLDVSLGTPAFTVNYTKPVGSTPAIYTFDACPADAIALTYNPSGIVAANSENNYVLTGPSGVVFNSGNPPVNGLAFSTSACPTCATPINLDFANISGTGATVTWQTGGGTLQPGNESVITWRNVDQIFCGNPGSECGSAIVTPIAGSYTYNLTGLDYLSTEYTIEVVENCTGPATSDVLTSAFTTAACLTACTYNFNLFDAGGDGWEGGYLSVVINSLTTQIDFLTGSSLSYPISVCPSDVISVSFTAGSSLSEVSFNITGPLGIEFTSSPSPANGIQYTVFDACNNCRQVNNLAVSNIIDVSATIGWTSQNSTATPYTVYVGLVDFDYTVPAEVVASAIGNTGSNPQSASISGLTASTTYEVIVVENCGPGSFSFPIRKAFTTASCAPAAQCVYTLNMFDSFGDGWNGGFMQTSINGGPLVNRPFLTGSSIVYSISVCPGDQIQFYFTGGSFLTETSFNVTGPAGIEYSSGFGPTNGLKYTVFDACPTCNPVTNVTVTPAAITATTNWTSNNAIGQGFTAYVGLPAFDYTIPAQVISQVSGVTVANPQSASFSGLAFSTAYEVVIVEDCDVLNPGNGTSFPVRKAFSTTAACPNPTLVGANSIGTTTANVVFSSSNIGATYTIAGLPGSPITGTVVNGVNTVPVTGLVLGTLYNFTVTTDCTPINAGFGSSGAVAGSFTTSSIVNDVCADAITISCGNSYAGSTIGAGLDAVPQCFTTGFGLTGVWYKFAGTNQTVTLTTCGVGSYDTKISVYTGTCGTLTCFAQNDDNSGCVGATATSEVTFNAITGTDYYVFVHGYTNFSSGAFNLQVSCVTLCPPVANDVCATAQTIAVTPFLSPVLTGGTNVCAGVDPNPTCDLFGIVQGVWYKFNSGSETQLILNVNEITAGTNSSVVVYTASCGGTQLYCSNPPFTEPIPLTVAINTDYYVLVYNDGGLLAGTFNINVTKLPPPPVNDNCTSATVINPTTNCATITGTTIFANPSSTPVTCGGLAEDDVWYKFTATDTYMTINVDGSTSFDATIELLSGTCAATTSLACSNVTGAGGVETITFAGFVVGQEYLVRVYDGLGVTPADPTFTICVTKLPIVQLASSYCGNLAYLTNSAVVSTQAVPSTGVTGYDWEYTELQSPFTVYTLITPNLGNGMLLYMFPQVQYGRTYSVRTRAHYATYTGQFGPACTIGLAPLPVTSLAPSFNNGFYGYCSQINAIPVGGATNYRWVFTDVNSVTYTINRPNWALPLAFVNGLLLGQTYTVQVFATVAGLEGNASTVRTINMNNFVPNTGMNPLINACGAVYAPNAVIQAVEVCKASSYTWRFVNTTQVQPDIIYTRLGGNRSILLTFPTGLIPGNSYNVTVKASSGGLNGDYSTVCNITIAGGNPGMAQNGGDSNSSSENKAIQLDNSMTTEIYPNPNRGDMVLVNLTSLSDENQKVVIDLYDVFGKKLQTSQIANSGSTMSSIFKFENDLSNGIYFINVTVNGKLVATERISVIK